MLMSRERTQLPMGRRRILVADGIPSDRDRIASVLSNEYDVVFVDSAPMALSLLRAADRQPSLMLLDADTPGMSAQTLLRQMKADGDLLEIPVVVMADDPRAELECLELGAVDSIAKPFSQPQLILARVRRCIELTEDREIIRSTERDPLTGLYRPEAFYRRCADMNRDPARFMDAVAVNVNRFHLINDHYGREYGDDVLRRLGRALRALAKERGGIACRGEGDAFLACLPHDPDPSALPDRLAGALEGDARIQLRVGVYPVVDRALSPNSCFERALRASDSLRDSADRCLAVYDEAFREAERFDERLLEDYPAALEQGQFKVFYQPKFDIRQPIPVLCGAEALVRWAHPDLGMLAPGAFIPLFERNGLISRLNRCVWRESAAQARDWKARLGISIPVSVNVSRVDMYDAGLIPALLNLLSEFELTPDELVLEITEAAYTQDSSQSIGILRQLRALGFCIAMDNFGTGYSSLSMLSNLPIDALKLDTQFIREAFREGGSTRMLEAVIDIADALSVPVVAEGVETAEQLRTLKALGCAVVQGFYFSQPVPGGDYGQLVREEHSYGLLEGAPVMPDNLSYAAIALALTGGFESIYYVNLADSRYVEFNVHGRMEDLQIERSGADFFADLRAGQLWKIYDGDFTRVVTALDRDALPARLSGGHTFTLLFHTLEGGEPVPHTLKAVRTTGNGAGHVVIGVSSMAALDRASAASQQDSATFSQIARVLAQDYATIYYVNAATGHYAEYGTAGGTHALTLDRRGDSFFNELAVNIRQQVAEEDRKRVAEALDPGALASALKGGGTLSLTYRLLVDGKPQAMRLKARRPAGDDAHIVIGIAHAEDEEMISSSGSGPDFSEITQALVRNYFCVYYVDTDTDEYVEYVASGPSQALRTERRGMDFFNNVGRSLMGMVYPEDRSRLDEAWKRQGILNAIAREDTFSISCRLLFDGEPLYVSIRAAGLTKGDGRHIIVGLSDIDTQMRRDIEYAETQALALRDEMTGVKNKRAYAQAEEQMSRDMLNGNAGAFALVVCDVNGLRQVNESFGYAAGDRYIKDACAVICRVFKHSPVYRIGGDEFAVLLRGNDYTERAALLGNLAEQNRSSAAAGGVVIACGMAQYIPNRDYSMSTLFIRADNAMYENKMQLKSAAT